MTIFVTGGMGFIGSNFVNLHLKKYDGNVVVIDSESYSANPDNLEYDTGLECYKVDIRNLHLMQDLYRKHRPKITYHFAAESHVDNSIASDAEFLSTNINGTYNILKCIQKFGGRLIHVSTDEVYGSLSMNDPSFTEDTPYNPRNPYSATKAASDHLVRAYVNTHGIDAIVTNCSNNYGPRQHAEKFIPTVIRHIKYNKPIPIYGSGTNVRDWLFVEDHCEALMVIGEKAKTGARYNIGGGFETSNLELAKMILNLMDKPESLISFVEDRKGHDLRYSMNSEKLYRELGWKAQTEIYDGLKKTISWYL